MASIFFAFKFKFKLSLWILQPPKRDPGYVVIFQTTIESLKLSEVRGPPCWLPDRVPLHERIMPQIARIPRTRSDSQTSLTMMEWFDYPSLKLYKSDTYRKRLKTVAAEKFHVWNHHFNTSALNNQSLRNLTGNSHSSFAPALNQNSVSNILYEDELAGSLSFKEHFRGLIVATFREACGFQ